MSHHTGTEINTDRLRLPLQKGVDTENIDHSLLQKAYNKYGPVPRNVYLAYSYPRRVVNHDDNTLKAIQNASYAQLERVARGGDRDASNKQLICLRRRIPGAVCATVLSRFVAEKLLKAEAFANLHEKRRLLRLFTAIPQMGVARGWLFEAYAHNRLSSFSDPTESIDPTEGITLYTLAPISEQSGEYQPDLNSATANLLFPLVDRTVYMLTNDFTDEPARGEAYHIPSIKNNLGFDSFLITADAVYIFQMTVSCTHTADTDTQKGLHFLGKILPQDVHWHYVLVVPPTPNVSSVTLTSVSKEWVDAVESFRLLVLQ